MSTWNGPSQWDAVAVEWDATGPTPPTPDSDDNGMWRQKINRVGHKRQRAAENMRTIMLVYGSGMIH